MAETDTKVETQATAGATQIYCPKTPDGETWSYGGDAIETERAREYSDFVILCRTPTKNLFNVIQSSKFELYKLKSPILDKIVAVTDRHYATQDMETMTEFLRYCGGTSTGTSKVSSLTLFELACTYKIKTVITKLASQMLAPLQQLPITAETIVAVFKEDVSRNIAVTYVTTGIPVKLESNQKNATVFVGAENIKNYLFHFIHWAPDLATILVERLFKELKM